MMTSLSDILDGMIERSGGDVAADLAQYLLSLRFTDEQRERCESLSYRNQEGDLTAEELAELDAYLAANTLLTIAHLKARRSLIRHSPAA